MVLTDAYRFPFSLFAGSRNSPTECSVERTGNVVETMDSSIGRSVLKIKGSVSANNYADFSGLSLLGNLVYIQLSLMKPAIATFHIELVTTGELALRLTFSTLYEQPRFLGRSLRLPLPPRSGWANLFFDIDQVLETSCPPGDNGLPWKMKAIKRIQLCSNMLVRDVLTTNTPILPNKSLPKELGVIASAIIPWINLSTGSPETLDIESSAIPPFSPEASIPKKNLFSDTPNDVPVSGGRKKLGSTGKPTSIVAVSPAGSVVTPRRGFDAMTSADFGGVQNTVHSAVPGSATLGVGNNTTPTQPVILLEHVNSYAGGPAVLLYGGSMMVLASGSLIVLIDLCSSDTTRSAVPHTGFWRYFHAANNTETLGRGGYVQTYLRGHTSPVGIIEQSSDGLYLITCETSPNGKLFLWNLQDGRRVATLQPHASSIVCSSISDDNSQLVTVGGDSSGRVQLIVWDIQCLILSCMQASPSNTSELAEAKKNMLIAKQLSDFPIQKIGFSPFQDKGLLSCGRENIRFWRIKKGHIPGRPVQLNEYSRGFIFTDFSFYADVSLVRGREQQIVFVASCKGMLLRVDCAKEQVLCAYQLHSGAICSLAVGDGVVITGGEDSRLRVWPLQFNDFLMEAHHESAVTHINISGEGGKFLSVGTVSGTLGVLNVFEHSYRTVLRSHVGNITSLSASSPLGDESLSVGEDGTIRLWDNMSGTQKFEFNSPEDQPLCGSYHPTEHVIACGFRSGAIRLFDVQTTSTIYERSMCSPIASNGMSANGVACPVACICFSSPNAFPAASDAHSRVRGIRLFGLAVDGRVTVFDVDTGYQAIRSAIVCPIPSAMSTSLSSNRSPALADSRASKSGSDRSLFMSVGANGALLAVAAGSALSTLTVVDTSDLSIVFKAGSVGDTTVKKYGNHNFHQSATGSGFAGSVKYGVSYPTSSPYYQPSSNPENDSSPEENKEFSTRKGVFDFATTNLSNVQQENVFAPGGKSDRPVVGLQFVSDPSGLGEYIAVFTTKHMITIGLGESSSVHSAVSTRQAAKVANIPSMMLSPAAHLHSFDAPDNDIDMSRFEEVQEQGVDVDASALSLLLQNAWENRSIKQILGHHHRAQAALEHSSGSSGKNIVVGRHTPDIFPTLAAFDAERGLLYVATVSTPRTILGAVDHDTAATCSTSLKVIGVTIRRGASAPQTSDSAFRLAVSLSPAQNYTYPAGAISCITPCGGSGRVATASASGILGMWRLQADSVIHALRQQQYAPSPMWPFAKGEGSAYVIGEQRPTAMAAVFEAEYNLDESHDYGKLNAVQQESKEDVQEVKKNVLEIEVASPAPGKLKKASSMSLPKRSPSWADSLEKRGPKTAASPGFPKSKTMSFQSPASKAKKGSLAVPEFNSPPIKKPGLPRPNVETQRSTPNKKQTSGIKKKRAPDLGSFETSTVGSVPDFFDDDDSPSAASSPSKDMTTGEPLSLGIEGIALKKGDTPPKVLKIDLTDLEKEISEAIKSPMPNNQGQTVALSPIRSGIRSPVIKTPVGRPGSSIPLSEDAEVTEGIHTKLVSNSGSTTYLTLEAASPDNVDDIVAQMEKVFSFQDFKGGRYIGSDDLKQSNKLVTREDFLNFSKTTQGDVSPGNTFPPTDMLAVPRGVPELRSKALSQRYSLAPQFSNESHLLLTSNGSSISLQRTDGTPGVVLNKPILAFKSQVWPHKGVVRSMSFSPSGLLVAAIVDYCSPSLPNSVYPAELVVWCATAPVNEADTEAALHWMCLGTVHLQTGAENRKTAGRSKLGWTHDDSLVLAVPVAVKSTLDNNRSEQMASAVGVKKSSLGCLISVTHWSETLPAAKSTDNSTYVATRAKASGGIDMPGILASLPFFSEHVSGMHVASWNEKNFLVGENETSNRASAIRIVFWSGKKMCIFEVTCPAAIDAAASSKTVLAPTVSLLWTDDTGNQGPFLELSLGWPMDSVHSFFRREDVMVLGKSLGGISTGSSLADGLGDDSSTYYAALLMPVPVIATLNGSGGLKFVRIRAFASTQTCSTPIPAAHTSGSPRGLSMSANGKTLVISYATAVQVYSVVHHMKEGHAYSVVLRFNYKVLLNFSPQFVSALSSFRLRHAAISQGVIDMDDDVSTSSANKSAPIAIDDVLVAGVDGDMGLISPISKYQRVGGADLTPISSDQFFRMSSSPCPSSSTTARAAVHYTTYLSVVVIPESCIVATITKGGALSLFHSETGISLPFPEAIIPTNCSAIAASKRMLAIGSACGRVCIYEARTMKVLKILFMPSGGSKSASSNITNVLSLLFVSGHDDSDFLVATLADGSVCVSSVPSVSRSGADKYDDDATEAGERIFRRISSQHLSKATGNSNSSSSASDFKSIISTEPVYLFDCLDDPNTFGVVRGDMVDLFTVEAPLPVTRSADAVGGLSGTGAPVVTRIGRVRLIDGHCEDAKKSNPRSPSTLRVYDLHIRRFDRKLVLTAISSSTRNFLQPVANVDLWVTVGSAELSTWGTGKNIDTNKVLNVNMMRRVALGLDYRQLINRSNGHRVNHTHYKHFFEDSCVVFTSSGVIFLDLATIHRKCEIAISEVSQEYPALLDVAAASSGFLDFSTLCGSEFESAIPGDGHRSLQESAVIAVARTVEKTKFVSRKITGSNDELEAEEFDEVEREMRFAFVCRSHPSPAVIRTQLL